MLTMGKGGTNKNLIFRQGAQCVWYQDMTFQEDSIEFQTPDPNE